MRFACCALRQAAKDDSWSRRESDELLKMPGSKGRRLHPRFPIRPGVLGARPATFLLEEILGLQEQYSYQDVSMHKVRAPGVVRGKTLVAICAAVLTRFEMCEPYS